MDIEHFAGSRRTATLRRSSFLAKRALLRPAGAQLSTESVGMWQRVADGLEFLLLHVAGPVFLQAAATRIVREAHQSAILVRVQVGRVRHGAHATLILL